MTHAPLADRVPSTAISAPTDWPANPCNASSAAPTKYLPLIDPDSLFRVRSWVMEG